MNINDPTHPTIDQMLKMAGLCADAAEIAARRVAARVKKREHPSINSGLDAGKERHPGADTPLWNVLVVQVESALKPYGAKARLARYLGVPRQRLWEFLNKRSRLPDGELTLRLLHWLSETQQGRDPSL